ncbi:MAG TPA: hypothetical protein VN519_10500 [Bryobacteraceae bacterium]|nr:hypothetical protein [Bryobacteraceae bacterium]
MTLDRERIERVLWGIWREFVRDFEITPINEIQDLRSFSVLWIALFSPEAVSARFQSTMTKAALQWRERPDFGHFVWFRVLPVEAGLYAITGDEFWISTILHNIDHHKSSLRTMTIETLALIADRLEFGADAIRRIERNIEVRHFFWEWPVILLAISKAPGGQKKIQLSKWLKSHEMDPAGREIVEKLANGGMVENPFLHRLLRIQQYLAVQLACGPSRDARQLDLEVGWNPEAKSVTPVQPMLFSNDSTDPRDPVWERISAHPLTASMIQIRSDM